MNPPVNPPVNPPRKINLALQGGGAHGAFSWGVLDRLLEDESLEIVALSGTSAGALNAAAFKSGILSGGRAGAKASLDLLWAEVMQLGDFRQNAWLNALFPFANAMSDLWLKSLPISGAGLASQLFSPYAMGPLWRNPLEPVVARLDFSQVRAADGPALFVSATNVRTGKIRVFSGAEVTPEVVLASCCLPTVFQAVELTDPATGQTDAFWDGGYSGNPALFPLYVPSLPDDVVIVAINPLRRDEMPRTPLEIQDRIDEISFNASLLAELRSVNFVHRLLADGALHRGTMKNVLVHIISDETLMNSLTATTKTAPEPSLIATLKAAGRAAASRFLKAHRADIGERSSVDLPGLFG